jgi:general secretion pathway protein J
LKSRNHLSNKFIIHWSFGIRNSSAFTLIEILIALALLTIVLGAVYSSFFSVQRALDRFDDVSLKYHEARTALDIMRREIEGAIVKNPRSDDKNRVTSGFVIKDRDILGISASSLELTSYSFRGNSLITVSYSVTMKDGKLSLVKYESPPAFQEKGYLLDIMEGISGFTVETFFNNTWVKTWDTAMTGRLPEIVRLSIEFDDNGKTVTLSEYEEPKIGTKL